MIIDLLVLVIVLILLFWAIRTLAAAFGLPSQLVAVLNVVLTVLGVLWIMRIFGLALNLP